ncbi:MAG: PilZ domain-containing protein [Candidatus Eremiobacteraeota bacterium]|nr:PilZ domain-containing protein [Candidatus Eremiobacteraeota bacterium]
MFGWLKKMFHGTPNEEPAHQPAPSPPRQVSIISADLPGFSCQAHDVTVSGAIVRLPEPVECGTVIGVMVDIEDDAFPTFEVDATVKDCQAQADGSYLADLDFYRLPPTEFQLLADFIGSQAGVPVPG